ncbi:conserved hypothetical protein [Sporisorium reilianum SRZ2]|uniref:C2H2-type domain-containing protein n=1 Tax=Sporisorium reilianum (strain SRZ2) TaxID=999809 RepID=E6ZR71_SPORE|nr:conserved hypothetical protein [Sporisorium reilianum SRZ2]
MTSVLANVRSHFTQSGMSNEPRFQYADLSRAMASSTSSSTLTQPPNPSSSSSSSTMPLAAATPATTLSSAPTTSDAAPHSQASIMNASVSASDPNALYSSSATIPSSRAFDSVLAGYNASSALADVSASCPPEGPSFSTNDFDANLAAAAFAPMFSSNDATGLDDPSAPLSFPVLPASLLDEAPEYEYSVHTRLNVFEATDFGTDIPSFNFADDGTPLLDGTAEYALWSTGLGVDAGDLTASSAFSYPNDDLALIDNASRLDTQPRTAGHFDLSSRPDDSFDVSSDSLPAPRNALPLASTSTAGHVLLGPNVSSGLSSLPGSSAAGLADGAPSVLQPASNSLHQRQPGQRLSLEGDDMYDSQAGPSRGLNRPRDALLSATSPYARGRPPLQAQRSLNNIGAAANFSPQGFDPELRRLSAGQGVAGVGAGRGPGRDPVVPSQNVGRARLMSWQSGRAYSGEHDWQSGNLADSALGVSGDAGLGAGGAHGMSDSMASNGMSMHAGGMMPPSRSYGYGMHPSSSGFMPHHGMNPHQTDMINALGDAMDARISQDGIAKCPYPNCNKTFAKNRSYNLKAHLRSHSQLKPFACSVCPRAFSRKHDLERHSRVHSGDKPYVCEICGKGFPRSDALRRHWRVEKECGDKAAALEASQSLTSVLGEGGMGYSHERSPDQQNHHLQYGQPLQGSSSSGMYGHGSMQQQQLQQQQLHQQQQQQQQQQRPPQQQQHYSSQGQQQPQQQQQQRTWADQQQQQQQQQQLRRA